MQTYSKGFYDLMSRGPDQQQLLKIHNTLIGFTRLSIMQLGQSGMQPYCFDIEGTGEQIIFICNGEIYNFRELALAFQLQDVQNRDCLVLPLLYMKLGFSAFVQLFKYQVKGEFAFALFKINKEGSILKEVILGRDMLGVRPLYVSIDNSNRQAESLVFGSSIGSLCFYQGDIDDFEPGTVSRYSFDRDSAIVDITTERFDWIYDDLNTNNLNDTTNYISNQDQIPMQLQDTYLKNIRESLIEAVRLRMSADQPICYLLSGGLDSSLVCSIAQSLTPEPIHTFCCGIAEKGQLSNTNDMVNARKVAKFLGTIHTEVTFTKDDLLAIVPEIVRYCGTQDVTTIRASIGMYFVCKHIQKKTKFKVIMSSDISDEVLVYLFAFELENGIQIHKAAKTLVKEVHKYDIVRVDRIVSNACSLEARLPFSDQDYIKACWSVPQELRHPKLHGHGKYWLRKAFDDDQDILQYKQWLPKEILWRVKSAFSDELMSNVQPSEQNEESIYSGSNLRTLIESKFGSEREYYSSVFESWFGKKRLDILKHYWQPMAFNENNEMIEREYRDPSATTLKCFTTCQQQQDQSLKASQ